MGYQLLHGDKNQQRDFSLNEESQNATLEDFLKGSGIFSKEKTVNSPPNLMLNGQK